MDMLMRRMTSIKANWKLRKTLPITVVDRGKAYVKREK